MWFSRYNLASPAESTLILKSNIYSIQLQLWIFWSWIVKPFRKCCPSWIYLIRIRDLCKFKIFVCYDVYVSGYKPFKTLVGQLKPRFEFSFMKKANSYLHKHSCEIPRHSTAEFFHYIKKCCWRDRLMDKSHAALSQHEEHVTKFEPI